MEIRELFQKGDKTIFAKIVSKGHITIPVKIVNELFAIFKKDTDFNKVFDGEVFYIDIGDENIYQGDQKETIMISYFNHNNNLIGSYQLNGYYQI